MSSALKGQRNLSYLKWKDQQRIFFKNTTKKHVLNIFTGHRKMILRNGPNGTDARMNLEQENLLDYKKEVIWEHKRAY